MIKIIYRQRKGTLKCLKENHKCQAQSQLYQYAIHCNWLSVEERGNNCQIQGYISQTVIQFDKKMSYLSSHQIASTPGRFLSLLKDATVKSQKWYCNFWLQPYKIWLIILHQLYTIKAEKCAAVNFFAFTLAKHIFCACANRLTASTDTRIWLWAHCNMNVQAFPSKKVLW